MSYMKEALIALENRGCNPCSQGLQCYSAKFTLPCIKHDDQKIAEMLDADIRQHELDVEAGKITPESK